MRAPVDAARTCEQLQHKFVERCLALHVHAPLDGAQMNDQLHHKALKEVQVVVRSDKLVLAVLVASLNQYG